MLIIDFTDSQGCTWFYLFATGFLQLCSLPLAPTGHNSADKPRPARQVHSFAVEPHRSLCYATNDLATETLIAKHKNKPREEQHLVH